MKFLKVSHVVYCWKMVTGILITAGIVGLSLRIFGADPLHRTLLKPGRPSF